MVFIITIFDISTKLSRATDCFYTRYTDVNECGQDPPVCLHGGTCSNQDGGFICTCTSGWTGNRCQQGNILISVGLAICSQCVS